MVSFELEKILGSAGEETFMHSENVEHIMKILVKNKNIQKEYSQEEIDNLIFASRYHDIGKSVIDKNILYSSKRLTDEEFNIIKTHSIEGKNLLKDEYTRDVLDTEEMFLKRKEILENVCKFHHKRQDGSGYPETKIGEIVPEYVEIVGIADVVEALTAKRSYREPFDIETVYNMIMEGKCGYFTEKAKNLLTEELENIKEFLKEKEELQTSIKQFVNSFYTKIEENKKQQEEKRTKETKNKNDDLEL